MSVRMAYLSPSLMSPIATPATAACIGTPASNNASEPPHTHATDAEPADSGLADTTPTGRGGGAGALGRETGCGQRQGAAAHRRRRRGAVGLENVRHDADRVREVLERGQH